MPEQFKREIAYKLRIGEILQGSPIIEEQSAGIEEGGKRQIFKFLELGSRQIKRINIAASVVDKFISEGEKKFATLTLDDASGQIKAKVFGEDTLKFQDINQGDTILLIGLLRSYNNEVYILPEIIRKLDPRYLLVRRLETEKKQSAPVRPEGEKKSLREYLVELIKSEESKGGIDTEEIIIKLERFSPDSINQDLRKMLEDGTIYEPRPGRVRYLG